MGLEANTSSTYINGLDGYWPTTADPLSEGDNHLRLIKDVLQRSFPAITGAVTVSNNEINNGIADTSTATNAATASTLVKRDASGNFSATVITSNFIGNLIGDTQGDVYASNGTSVVVQNGTDGTDAIFTGTATKAAAIEVDGASADVEHRMVFGEDNDGIDAPEYLYKDSAANFTYNPSTNALTAGSFVGAVALSNVTGLQSALDAKTTQAAALLAVYPIGSVYTSVVSTDPSNLFGGNWAAFGEGRMLLGAGGGYTAGDTDGSATHTLTAAESGLPSHSHTQRGGGFNGSVGIEAGSNLFTSLGETGTTGGTNASQAHNNMPPYIVVYMFKRIAD